MRTEHKKKKRQIAWLAMLLCLLFSVSISVIVFSGENIANLTKNRDCVSLRAENLELQGWERDEKGLFHSGEQAAINAVFDTPVYISNLRLNGSVGNDVKELKFTYTDGEGAQGVGFAAPLEIRNKDVYLKIDRTVLSFCIQTEGAGECFLKEDAIVVNPRNLNCNVQLAVLIFFLPFTLILLVSDMLIDRDSFKKTFGSLFHFRFLLSDLVSKDIKTKYRRSVLGILWSVLNPLLMMLVLTAVFSQIFRFEIKDFPVYYLTGYVIFNFVTEATSFSMTSIINSAGLIKKVYIPKMIFPLEKCLFSLVNFLFSLIAAVIVFLIVRVEPHWTILLFPIPVLFTFIFNLGFSLILATMNTFFRDVGYLYNVFITVWMYLTPIIYPMSILPGWMQSIVRLNPLYHYIEYFRNVVVYGVVPPLSENLICLAYALVFLFAGILIFQRKQNQFIFYV